MMVKLQHPSMASLHRKHNHLNNLNSLFKKPPTLTHRITFDGKKSKASATAKLKAEALHVREAPSKNKVVKNGGDEEESSIFEVYPFVKEPVLFNFGKDFGLHLFVDFKNEILDFGDEVPYDDGRRLFVAAAVEEMDGRNGGDVYAFSPEADVMASFSKDGLL